MDTRSSGPTAAPELAALSPLWPLGAWRAIDRIPQGQNENYRVTTDAGDFVLRLSRPSKTRASLEIEVAALDAVAKACVPARPPARTHAGAAWAMAGTRFATMTPFITGEPYKSGAARRRAIGAALAACHTGLRTLEPPVTTPQYRKDLTVAEKAQRPGPWRDAYAEAARLEVRLAGVAPYRAAGSRMLIHGSCRKSSVLFQGDRLVALLDFDSIRLGDRAEDLAIALLSFAKRDRTAIDLERVAEISDGYSCVTTLDPGEAGLVVHHLAAIMLRRVERNLGDAEAAGADATEHRALADDRLAITRSILEQGAGIVGLLSQ